MNKVFSNKEGIIEQVYSGKQDFKTVIDFASQTMVIADELIGKKRKVRILVNIRHITGVTADSLLASADALNSFPSAKIAIFGGKRFFNKLTRLVISATRKQETVKIFNSKKKAVRWLKNG
jgi:hypothetical protein